MVVTTTNSARSKSFREAEVELAKGRTVTVIYKNSEPSRRITADDEPRLVRETIDLTRQHGRYGHQSITAMLRRKGWKVNNERIDRRGTVRASKCTRSIPNAED